MILSRYIVWFLLFSFCGWIWETVYCTARTGKWQARGFLFGPVCPIYGICSIALIAILYFITWDMQIPVVWWQVFLLSFFGSAVVEYITHYTLEKLFHAYWWDYSHMPLNINGRVCVPAATLFGMMGLAIWRFVLPWCDHFEVHTHPLLVELMALVGVGLISADMTMTVVSLTNVSRVVQAIDYSINERMTHLVEVSMERGHHTEEMLAAERERMREETVLQTMQRMGGVTKATLMRVHGFHVPSSRQGFAAAQKVLDQMKDIVTLHGLRTIVAQVNEEVAAEEQAKALKDTTAE